MKKKTHLVFLPVFVFLFTFLVTAHSAPKTTDKNKQKQTAEAERIQLRKKLSNLKLEISRTESEKNQVANTLARSEKAIIDTNRSLQELDKKQTQTETRLAQLVDEHAKFQVTIQEQQNRLAKLFHEQYTSGNEDRLKLLLSGDNPNRISRELQYMNYISQAQTKLISTLRVNLQVIEKNRIQTENTKQELDGITKKKQAQKELLEKEKANRAVLLSQLSTKLDSQKKQATRLEQDDKRLTSLVDRLTRTIEQQKKTTARKTKKSKQTTNSKNPANPRSQKQDTVEAVPEVGGPDGAFAKLRGQLRLPVRGTITARYGSKRADGPSWKGLFIRTEEGAEVRAVANGRVIFADSLRGFGNLIIVDHGSQYMTIYGNAKSLNRKVGDAVKGSDVIAYAGNSGGNEQIGLYFEMRHNGRAFNPLDWVTTR